MAMFWRQEEPVLNDAGQVIVGGMWPSQRLWWNGEKFIKAFVAGYGSGKAQPVDRPVLTLNGWASIGLLQPGDQVMSPTSGRPISVLSVHPQGEKDVYRVSVTGGAFTECCAEHLWTVQGIEDRCVGGTDVWRTLPTSKLQQDLTYHKRYKAPNWSLPSTVPLLWERRPVELDPYLLGVLIGDGSLVNGTVSISCADEEILQAVQRALPDSVHLKKNEGTVDYAITTGGRGGANRHNPVLSAVRKLELSEHRSHEKFIPRDYLFSDVETRIAVLQGLLDTDGYVDTDGSVFYSTSSEQLKSNFMLLVEALGGNVYEGKASIPEYTYKGEKKNGRLSWYVYVKLPPEIRPFRLTRKATRYDRARHKQPTRYIKSIDPVGRKECVCIRVDSADGLYLTDRCLVTHNTLIAAKRAVSLALHNAPSPHVCVSPTYKTARRTIVPMIRNLLAGKQSLIEGLSFNYNKSDFEFEIKYGERTGTIWILSGEDPQSLKGPNIGSANIDEPFIQDREVFEQIMARVRDPESVTREIGLTGTPEEMNWGYDICEGEEKDNFEIDVVHASSTENKALPKNYVERLKKALTERAAMAYLDGQFVSLSDGLVYYGFSNANIQELEPPGPNYELGAGMDFNVNPMAATVFWTAANHIHFMDEIELPNADTEYMCGELIQKYGKLPDGRSRVRSVYPDATGKSRHTNAPGGKSDYHYIREAGLDLWARPNNPPRRDRYNAVNGKLAPKGQKSTMTVSPKCKKLIAYCKQYAHEKMNDEHQKRMSHLLDAMGYPVAYLFPVKPLFELARVTGV